MLEALRFQFGSPGPSGTDRGDLKSLVPKTPDLSAQNEPECHIDRGDLSYTNGPGQLSFLLWIGVPAAPTNADAAIGTAGK